MSWEISCGVTGSGTDVRAEMTSGDGMPGQQDRPAVAVLVTGVFGSGKSSLAMELADLLGDARAPYALLDLDFLAWFDTGGDTESTEREMMLANLDVVAANYLRIGVRHFILALAVSSTYELDSLRAVLRMPLRVVRLVVPLAQIEKRLSSDVTTGRRDDLRVAGEWIATDRGAGIEDVTVSNQGPIRQVAAEVLDWLGWLG